MNQESINHYRHRAESILKRKAKSPVELKQKSHTELYEELSIHQIELEMQMDELQKERLILQQEKKKFEDLYLKAPVAYITINRTGNILLINEMGSNLFNLSRYNLNRISIFSYVSDESKNNFQIKVKRAFDTQEEQSGVVHLMIKNKATQFCKFQLNTYHNIEEVKTQCRITLTSIADEKSEFEKILNRKDQEYRQIAENIKEGMLITEKGIIKSLNPAFSKMLGIDPEYLKQNPIWAYVSKKYRPKLINILQSKEINTQNIEIELIKSSKEKFWAQLSINNYQYDSNKTTIVVTDISERKKAENALKISENALRESNAMKDKFLSILAHDLKSPFTSIIGFSQLLIMDQENISEEKQAEYLNNISTTAKNTHTLLENLLLWSLAQAGNNNFSPTSFNINLVIDKNICLFREIAKGKNIRLSFKTEKKENIVHADVNMTDTIIRNLISNAIKFTPENGSVIIGISDTRDQKLTVFVSDNGIGIPKEDIEKIFDIGEKTSREGTNNEKGSGLGLSLCKEFVEQNNGEIWVESSPEVGSRFFFTLVK